MNKEQRAAMMALLALCAPNPATPHLQARPKVTRRFRWQGDGWLVTFHGHATGDGMYEVHSVVVRKARRSNASTVKIAA